MDLTITKSNLAETLHNDPILLRIIDYVDQVRGNRPFATLADIDFFAIAAAVPHLFTMTITGVPPRFRYKFSGTQCDEIVGRNPMGMYVDELYPRPGHQIVASYLDIVRQRKTQILRASFYEANSAPRVLFRLAIPLANDGQTLSHIFGALVMHYDHQGYRDPPQPGRPQLIDMGYIDEG